MRFLAVCAAPCLWAGCSTAMEFEPAAVAFAYSGQHAASNLPTAEVLALRPEADTAIDPLRPFAAVEPIPAPPRKFSRHELCSTAASIAEANDLPIPFFANLIQQESGWQPHVVSPAGAQGIAQFMPRVARAYGLHNPFDPIHALVVSGKFLGELVRQFGNLGLAAAAYNAGPKRVQDWMARRGKLPAETRNYVRNITGYPAERWTHVKAAGLPLPPFARCPDAATREAQAIERLKPVVTVAALMFHPPQIRGRKTFILASAPTGKKATALPNSAIKTTKVALKSVPKIMAPEKPSARVRLASATAKAVKSHVTPTQVARMPLRLKPALASARPATKAIANKAKPTTKRIRVAAASRRT